MYYKLMKIIFKKQLRKVTSFKFKVARKCRHNRLATCEPTPARSSDRLLLATSSGFVAIFLVMSAMVMMTLSSLGAFSAAESYNDSVSRHEYRLVASQNAKSCISVAILAFAHDYFYTAQNQIVPDFSCTIVSASRNGSDIFITALGYDNDVTESVSATAEDNGRSIDLVH